MATAYLIVRDDYTTCELRPLGEVLAEVGQETELLDYLVPAMQPDGEGGFEQVELTVTPTVFRAYASESSFAYWMAHRPKHSHGGFLPNMLELGFRPLVIEYEPGDVVAAESGSSHVLLTRADVVEELDAADVYAVYAPPAPAFLNYYRVRNSMQELIAGP